jgi:fucose permease
METNRPRESLWVPIVAPVVWSTHFMAVYIWAAMACGRFAGNGGFERARSGITILTVVAAAIIALCFWYGFRRHGYSLPDRSNDDGTPADRTKFMAFMTMLLAALSLVGVLFAGIAATAVGGCL